MKMKYDESDNTLIRASRAVTDRVTDFLGNFKSVITPALFFDFHLIVKVWLYKYQVTMETFRDGIQGAYW